MQISPQVMETLLRGYLNNWAETGLALSDWAIEAARGGPPQPAKRLDQMPLVRRFYEQEPARTTRYVTDYFNALREATEARQTMRKMDQSGRPDIATELQKTPENLDRDQLVRVDKTMGAIRKDIDAVTNAPDLASARKLAQDRAKLLRDPGMMGRLQSAGTWNDVAQLKRYLIDSLTAERNDLARTTIQGVDRHHSSSPSSGP
jgi:hypothetical protein